jgi:thiol-disulfide isomerase/thioredoxin
MWKYRLYFIITGLIVIISLCLILYRSLSEKKKLFVRLFVYSLLLEIGISPLRGYVSFQASTIVGFTLYSILTYILLIRYSHKASSKSIFFSLIFGFSTLNIIRIFNFAETLISLPDACFHLFGIIVGYSLFKIKNYFRWIILVIASLLTIFIYSYGYELWLNRLNYGSFTGKIIEGRISKEITFSGLTSSKVNINSLKGNIVLLDFWNSKCGVCFRKFPVVQRTYNKYKHNTKISFYSVNSFLKGIDKDDDAFRIIKERGYSFPVLICKNKTILKELKITCYPTVLIINKKGELIFRGDIEDADKKIEELLKYNN